MKEKIKYIILGMLIGAVITAGVFLILKKDNQRVTPSGMPNMEQFDSMNSGERRERPSKDSESATEDNSEAGAESQKSETETQNAETTTEQ